MNPQFLSLTADSSIQQAFEVIEKSGIGLALILDFEGRFVRTVTDGDLRRLLIAEGTTGTSLKKLGHIQSVWASYTADASTLLAIMKKHDIQHVPILDDDFRPIDVAVRKNIESPVLLSSPHMGEAEMNFINEAFDSNWIAPLGPNVEKFEEEFAKKVNCKKALSLSSGTAALHLALIVLGVMKDDIVFCSSLTFVASANPILYQGAIPVFIDSEPDTWNMSPVALEKAIKYYKKLGKKPKAVIVVNLYGQSADMNRLVEICDQNEIPIIEDAAESLGSTYHGKPSGTFGKLGIYSFNGNKIITTSGGGMLVSNEENLIDHARFLSTQAKDPAKYYLHSHVGYNYRMSNILAGVGRGQLLVLDERVSSRREVFRMYVEIFKDTNFFDWMPEPEGYYSTRWLTCGILKNYTGNIENIIDTFMRKGIEVRRTWKPLHTQPLFKGCMYFEHEDGKSFSDYVFEKGVCLPSGSNMVKSDIERVTNAINSVLF